MRCWIAYAALCLSAHLAAGEPTEAARALIGRILPGRETEFALEVIPADAGRDVYEVEVGAYPVVLRGNSGISLASAFNAYLRDVAQAHVSWNGGDQLALPDPLPPAPQKMRVVSPYPLRFAYNYCTHGYTMAWWDWSRWERELDFLAMQGVNLALVLQGQEQVWIEALAAVGYGEAEVRQWLTMPSHQPWQYMSNMEDYGGPYAELLYAEFDSVGRYRPTVLEARSAAPSRSRFGRSKAGEGQLLLTMMWSDVPGGALAED